MLTPLSYTQANIKRFFKTPGGRALGILDKEAQQLAYYLLCNPHFDTSGNYRLPLSNIAADTSIPRESLKQCFALLSAAGFCTFDAKCQRVFIPFVQKFFAEFFQEKTRT